MSKKRVLVIGATGTMGRYLVPELVQLGFQVTGVSLDMPAVPVDGVEYRTGNCYDLDFLASLVEQKFDGIVNFMTFPQKYPFEKYYKLFLDNTDHYIFLSSCRVYADEEWPVKETSPRLVDVSKDQALLDSYDYCMHKARAEDLLWASGYENFTIVRPATTFSESMFKLVTWEAPHTIARARKGKKVVLPIQAKDKPATLCWGGDVAKMIARLMFKPETMKEAYNVCSSEHHTWGEIAEFFEQLCGLKAVWVDKEDYLRIRSKESPVISNACRWQLEYARLFHRITDNSKMLKVTGLKQEEFVTLYDALEKMFKAVPENYVFPESEEDVKVNARMDAYLEEHGL